MELVVVGMVVAMKVEVAVEEVDTMAVEEAAEDTMAEVEVVRGTMMDMVLAAVEAMGIARVEGVGVVVVVVVEGTKVSLRAMPVRVGVLQEVRVCSQVQAVVLAARVREAAAHHRHLPIMEAMEGEVMQVVRVEVVVVVGITLVLQEEADMETKQVHTEEV